MAYRVSTPPDNPEQLRDYLQTELGRIAAAIEIAEIDIISFRVWQETPPKLREGDEFYGAKDVGVVGAAGWRIVDATGIKLR
jgi:hypothetical protein